MKHEFALFWSGKNSLHQSDEYGVCVIDDPVLYHRLMTVLRLKKDDTIVLFDRTHHYRVQLKSIEKKQIVCTILDRSINQPIQPSITFLLPLLKRDALHETIYTLTEAGCTTIQLITSKKIQSSWQGQKELEKLQKIAIAATEQSKNFNIPEIKEPQSLETYMEKIPTSCIKIFFDAQGMSCNQFFIAQKPSIDTPLHILIGPEGDLTPQEKEFVATKEFVNVKLTPTILRAQQAAFLGVGIIRSLIDTQP